MPIRRVPEAWNANASYNIDDVVLFNGIRFVCTTAVPASAVGNVIPVDNTSWRFDSVLRIVDAYSLYYSIQLDINTDDDMINNSIPLYVQNVERKLSKSLRSPAQKITRTFPVRAGRENETLFDIPSDMLATFHLRSMSDDAGYNLESRGAIVIQGTDYTSFERLRERYISNGYYLDNILDFDYPVYVMDDTTFKIAPRLPDEVTHVELTYYQQVPELTSIVEAANDDYEPVNSAGQTLAQWVAAGNTPESFQIELITVLDNLWTATTPHLLKAGALVEAYSYLNNPEDSAIAKAQFDELLAMTISEFRELDYSGAQASVMGSAYAIE